MGKFKDDAMRPMDYVVYALIYTLMFVLSLLPLRVLYLISDFLYVVIYRMVGYRKAMVRKNLRESFPEKTDEELTEIERGFYSWFCDYIVETVKVTTMTRKEMRRRLTFQNLEVVEEMLNDGKPVTICLGHYCNWEWVTSLGLHLPKKYLVGQLYHELENRAMNHFFLRNRGRYDTTSIRMDQTLQTLIRCKKEGRLSAIGYIADQAPGMQDMHCWPWFLNHDTPVYTGPERMSRILGAAMVYFDISRPKRGYYVINVMKITGDACSEDNFKPTLEFFRLLEENIRREPYYWLWTHNRWKRTREDFNNKFTEEQRKKILSRP